MNVHASSSVCIAGLLFMNMVVGCKEDPVGPEQQATYETAVFGTFRGISALISFDGSTYGSLSLDTTSYIHTERSDQSYSIKLHGTDLKTHTLNVSFEEVGHMQIKDVTYQPTEGWSAAHWDGSIIFTPDSALHHSPWTVQFYVYCGSTSDMRLNVSYNGGSSSIFLGQDKGYIRLVGWRTRQPY
jgi:hypothetical protein